MTRKIVLVFLGALLLNCAPVKPIGDNKFQVTCSGDSNKCQEKAWKYCNGPFNTLQDDQTESGGKGQWTEGMYYGGGSDKFKIVFKCGEN